MRPRRTRGRAVRYGTTRRSRAAVSLLAAVLGLPPLLTGLAHAQGTTAALSLNLTITQISPTAPQPGDELLVGGVLSNPTDLEYDDVSLVLRVLTSPLQSRAALLAVTNSSEHLAADPVGAPIHVVTLAAHESAPYLFRLPVDALGLAAAGVYRVSVEAYRGPTTDEEYDARVNTFLPWLPPSAAVTPVQVAWVWPLLTTPRLQADGTFSDDGLGTEVAPTGRLGRLLEVANQAATQNGVVPTQGAPPVPGHLVADPAPTPVPIRPVPVTPVVDPETLQELELMTGPYTAKGAPGAHSADATGYLSGLRTLMSATSTITTPYGDPDIEALAAAHASALVTQARSTGLEAGWPNVATGLLWPPDGTLSASTLDTLTTSGLVLSNRGVPLTNGATLGYTPSATTAVERPGGTLPAVVVDDGLSNLATTPVPVQDRVLLTQRFAAETAAIAVEAGATAPRTLVLAPGRRWSPTESSIRALLDETGRLPWLTPATVPQVLAAAPDSAAVREPLHTPATQASLPQGLADRIAAADAELAGFRSILCPAPAKKAAPKASSTTSPTAATSSTRCDPDDQVLPLQRSLYRAASTAFRKPGSGGEQLVSGTLAAVRANVAKVKIIANGDEELIGNLAKLPISILNGLTVPIKVQVVLLPRSTRLLAYGAVPLVIAAGGNAQLNLPLRRESAGSATLQVDVQLLTPAGRHLGTPVTLQVHVSAYGVVVVTITIAVCGLLGLAVIVRIYRRIRNARRRSRQAVPDGDVATAAVAGQSAPEPGA